MTLLEAFKRAKHAVVAKKADTVGRHVRLVRSGATGTMDACTGLVTTRYRIDDAADTLPDDLDVCISIDEVMPAIAQANDVALRWYNHGANLALDVTQAGDYHSSATLHVLPPSNFKSHPIPETEGECIECDPRAGVVAEFTGDDPAAPQYSFVDARANGFCATDMYSALCYQTDNPWLGLVPADVFMKWPLSWIVRLWAHTQGALLTMHMSDEGPAHETRFASYGTARNFPGVWARMKPDDPSSDALVVVDRKVFSQAVKQATGCSTLGCVWLRHTNEGTLLVQGHVDRLKGGQAFNATIKADHSQGFSPKEACYDGKRLLAVLKAMSTVGVVVSQSQPEMEAPLRIEGGRSVALVFRTSPEKDVES